MDFENIEDDAVRDMLEMSLHAWKPIQGRDFTGWMNISEALWAHIHRVDHDAPIDEKWIAHSLQKQAFARYKLAYDELCEERDRERDLRWGLMFEKVRKEGY